MGASEWIALAALIVAIPAMIIGIANAARNRFNLSCYFRLVQKTDLYEDIKEKTPSDYRRLFGVLEYINYSPIDFYINKIDLHVDNNIFPAEQLNDRDRDIMRIVYPVIPFKNIPIYQRSSNEIQLVVDLPKSTDFHNGIIFVYTSYRKKPYEFPIHDLIQSP